MKFKWFLALKKNNGKLFDFKYEKLITAPENRYYADPFIYKHKNLNYIFFEDYDYIKGVISCMSVDSDLNVSEPMKILEEPFHLSYPFIFDYKDEIYMIPESAKSNKISLYKCKQFPNKWEKIHTLIDHISARDTTLYINKKGIYLFTSLHCNNLQIYYSKDLFGKFNLLQNLNSKNTIRNGGKIFTYNNELYRICQDSKDGIYGKQFIIKKIINLYKYQEKDFKLVKPDWHHKIIGTHTFNFNNDIIIWDGKDVVI